MTKPCGCCATCLGDGAAGTEKRPGLPSVGTRIGSHASFFEAMVLRLSAQENAPLERLRARDRDDPSIALLDGWALVADVLSFYQERIANEAYLRTAKERRSLIEIARLVGYRPRPGVAATAHLAFSLENESDPAEIAEGTRVNSVPGPGEQMVAFETSEAIVARREWNVIRPRLTRPQTLEDLKRERGLYVKGTKTRLKPTSPVLIRIGTDEPRLLFVREVIEDSDRDRTLVTFDLPRHDSRRRAGRREPDLPNIYGIPIRNLARPGAVPPTSSAALARSVGRSFATSADTLPRLLGMVQPALSRTLYRALRNLPPPDPEGEAIQLFAMRVDARPFGHNAPLRLKSMVEFVPDFEDWKTPRDSGTDQKHGDRALYLDNDYDILSDSMVAIDKRDASGDRSETIILGVPEMRDKEKLSFSHVSLSAYGMSGKSVLLSWSETQPWLDDHDLFPVVRSTRVFAGSEELELAEAPIADDVAGETIELDQVYDGLEPGRWLIVEGERSDILDASDRIVPGIRAAELVMLQGVEQSSQPLADQGSAIGTAAAAVAAPQEKLRTILRLAAVSNGGQGLAYRYKRDTVRIHANVARATHGETRSEILGNGDAALALQTFSIKQPPLTHVTAATTTGTKSTLEIRVNDLIWREARSLAGLGPNDRCYVTRDNDEGVTSIIFGNGVRGARPPSGRENVKAAYRNGIGRPGNVAAEKLTLLATRPLGVKEVINPLPASGGADREDLQSIRRNASVALMALDRLVSTPDYASFARAFGGIGKASSVRMEGLDVAVVVAGVDDSPVPAGSEILTNLADAMRRFGDPQVSVRVDPRERLVMIIQAGVQIEPDRQWTVVEPKVRAALLEEFSFNRVEIGESLPLARALKAIQAVDGVTYADVDIFDHLSEEQILKGITLGPGSELERHELLKIKPNEIAYLAAEVPETLILQELKS